jgi:hypothetical protein
MLGFAAGFVAGVVGIGLGIRYDRRRQRLLGGRMDGRKPWVGEHGEIPPLQWEKNARQIDACTHDWIAVFARGRPTDEIDVCSRCGCPRCVSTVKADDGVTERCRLRLHHRRMHRYTTHAPEWVGGIEPGFKR